MLDPETTRHDDLRSGAGPWNPAPERPRGRRLERDIRCDVAIVGAGITGAFVAEHLTAMGLDVVVIDREREGYGSTAASTAMLQWEIDLPLRGLASLYGFETAAEIYRLSCKSVEGLRRLVHELALPCDFAARQTVYLAAGEIGLRELQDEVSQRQRAGLPSELVDGTALRHSFGFIRPGAIISSGSAEADPLALCHALLATAARRGAQLIRDEAIAFDGSATSAVVGLGSGRVVEAAHLVLATGYVMPEVVCDELHHVASSWAIATVPQPPQALWLNHALVWEASQDYCYFRTTSDGRIIFGGEDENFADPKLRDQFAPSKTEALRSKLRSLMPMACADLDRAWSGAFGETADGLPLIGGVPKRKRMFAAYGYGGNGITFSFLASRIIGMLIRGEKRPWFRAFAIDRPPLPKIRPG